MIEDITVRKFTARTRENHLRAVKGSNALLGAPPDTPGHEDLRCYRLRLVAVQPGLPPRMAPIDKRASLHMLRRSQTMNGGCVQSWKQPSTLSSSPPGSSPEGRLRVRL